MNNGYYIKQKNVMKIIKIVNSLRLLTDTNIDKREHQKMAPLNFSNAAIGRKISGKH
jgi:hypothetical protein